MKPKDMYVLVPGCHRALGKRDPIPLCYAEMARLQGKDYPRGLGGTTSSLGLLESMSISWIGRDPHTEISISDVPRQMNDGHLSVKEYLALCPKKELCLHVQFPSPSHTMP